MAVTMAFFAMAGSLFLLTQLLQFVMGYDALAAGLRMAPLALVFLVVAPLSAHLAERVGAKLLVACGLCVAAFGLLVLATAHPSAGYGRILVGTVLMGGGVALGMVPATDSIMGSLPKEKAGVGSAVNDTTRQVGGALGVAILGSILASGYRSSLTSRTAHLGAPASALAQARTSVGGGLLAASSLTGRLAHALADASRAAFVSGMRLSFVLGAAMMVGGALIAYAYLPAHAEHRLGEDERTEPSAAIDEPEVVGTVTA
jgi:Na+/melibiose symporter-like transporter